MVSQHKEAIKKLGIKADPPEMGICIRDERLHKNMVGIKVIMQRDGVKVFTHRG
jgi:hypothetical protein